MKELKHVRQEDPLGCAVACAAMVAGVSYNDALDAVAVAGIKLNCHGMSQRNLDLLLDELGVVYEHFRYPSLHRCGVFIAVVSSLNVSGGLHYVVFDYRDGWKILDPQRGRKAGRCACEVYDGKRNMSYTGLIYVYGWMDHDPSCATAPTPDPLPVAVREFLAAGDSVPVDFGVYQRALERMRTLTQSEG